jgi:hypothetical protein
MVLCGGKGSPGVWAREKMNPKGHILLSDDGGENWRIATRGLEKENPWMPWVLLRHPSDSATLFCGMGDGARGYGFDARVKGRGALRQPDRGDRGAVLNDTIDFDLVGSMNNVLRSKHDKDRYWKTP